MNFKNFLAITEASRPDYDVINRPEAASHLAYVPLGIKLAREAEEKFQAGRLGLMPFLKKQEVGFRAIINGTEYLRSIDGIFEKKIFPLSGYQGSAIGQRELYSPRALKNYTKDLKEDPTHQTDPVTVTGKPNAYKVVDGHHRMEAYKRAGRTEVPVWIEKTR